MGEEKRKSNEELIKDLTNQIISNSKDAKWAREMLQQLKGLLQMNKLIDVSLEEVTDKLDFGANVLYKVRDGYIWECKGGMTIHVSVRMARVCTMLNTLIEMYQTQDSQTEAGKELFNSFSTAVAYIMQAPIFSSLDERALFQNATSILSAYQEYCVENYTNAKAPERTEEDYKEDAEAEQAAKALEILAEAPLPPEDY